MKKLISIPLICLLIFCAACSPETNPSPSVQPVTDTPSPTTSNSDDSYHGNTLPEVLMPYYFSNYQQLADSLRADNATIFSPDRLTTIEEVEKQPGAFALFLQRVRSAGVFKPMFAGADITLEQREGYSIISLIPSDFLKRPAIYIRPTIAAGNLPSLIFFSYLSDEEKISATDIPLSQLLQQIDPQYPQYPMANSAQAITLQLAGRTAPALIYTPEDDPRTHIFFPYDDILVSAWYDPAVCSLEWFSQLSFEQIPIPQ
ncbi:hypothetical protein FACS1894217_10730 [Clostridia bacterium]|nr:hypothetical protein FACS1894217_10730 [Clostridia bacterium]